MNFAPDLFAGQRFAVVGLGRNGAPAARALAAMGAEIVAWDDSDSARAANPGLTLRDPTSEMARFDALVLSPGVPHDLPTPHRTAQAALAAGVPILSDSELLFQAVRRSGSRARFAGITGTNGKSTTTALLAHIFAVAGVPAAAGGNLGPAALGLPLLPDHGVYVLEMSSYMLERLQTMRFDAAAMLNLSADHLDRHGSMQAYSSAKRAIFARQTEANAAVIGIDDADSRAMAETLQGPRVVRISGRHRADIGCESSVLQDAAGPIVAMADAASLPGAHNAQNAAAAVALALHLDVARDAIARGITSFRGLDHRQQRVATVDRVTYVNDSKATNADAAARALSCYDRVVWIAGGIAKAGGIESLHEFFPRIAHAVLIGRDAPLLSATLAEAGVPHTIADTLAAAVPIAQTAAQTTHTQIVLLSPACASFDQFPGFDARGDHFRDLVLALPAGRTEVAA